MEPTAGPAFRPLLTDIHVGALAEVDHATWVQAVGLWGRGAGIVAGPLAARAYGADCPWDGRRKVGVEFDGPEHRTVTGQNRDHLRDADLDDVGWEIIRIGAAQVLDERLADALAARILRKIL